MVGFSRCATDADATSVFAGLAADIGFAGFPLGIEGGEGEVEIMLGRFASARTPNMRWQNTLVWPRTARLTLPISRAAGPRRSGTTVQLGACPRWLDGSMSVPIVVELLLRLMVRRGIRPAEVTASRHGQTSAKPRSGRTRGLDGRVTDRAQPAPSCSPRNAERPSGSLHVAMPRR
jgi:hypothetical protein